MSINEIHYKILWILNYNFKVDNELNLSAASFTNDLKFNSWEINMLLYYIEQALDIKLKRGLETEIDTINQLVSQISKKSSKYDTINRKISAGC
jgi:acyl carrier protein